MEKLDEKGFVFMFYAKATWCCIREGSPWFMYWHNAQKSWVTLYRVNEAEISMARETKISYDMAELYHQLHAKQFDDQWCVGNKS